MKTHRYIFNASLLFAALLLIISCLLLINVAEVRASYFDSGASADSFTTNYSSTQQHPNGYSSNAGPGAGMPAGGNDAEGYGSQLFGTGRTTSEKPTSQSLADIQKRIADLLEQIRALKDRLAGIGGQDDEDDDDSDGAHEPGVCRALQNLGNFRRGMSGPGVRTIQRFLATEGVLTSDNVTGYFGTVTEQALRKWQHQNDVVASSTASSTGSGAFGPMTRAAMFKKCENHDGDGVSAFRVSPAKGEVPLTVELAGLPSAVLKKINECKYSIGWFGASGNGLSIDWGDGTESPKYSADKRGSSCTNEVKKHTYTKAGTYTVKIESWHPGPTDQAIYDWKGSAKVVVIADEDEDEEEGGGDKGV